MNLSTQELDMKTKNLKTIPKISIKIWQPIIDKLDEKMERQAFDAMPT